MRLLGFLERFGIKGKRPQISVFAIACACLLIAIGFTVAALAGSEGTPLAKGAPPVPTGEALTALKSLAAKELGGDYSNARAAAVPTLWAPAVAALRAAGVVVPTPLMAGPKDPVYLVVFRGDIFCQPGCQRTYGTLFLQRSGKFLSFVVEVVNGSPKWILPPEYLSDRSPDLDSLGPVTELGHL